MIATMLAVAVSLTVWALFATKFEQWRISAPMVTVAAGVVVGLMVRDSIGPTLDTETALHAAEVVLAVLLFIDATEVRGGLFGRNPGAALRLLLIALPLSLAAAVGLGLWLLPGSGWAVLLVIACVVVPIDFAPAAAILRDRRIPVRVRNILNVESGYNDGIVSPIIIFALILAGDLTQEHSPLSALGTAAPAALKALVVGAGCGAALAFLTNQADAAHLMNLQSKRLIMVAAPLGSYALSVAVDGNGFVAAFICGFVIHRIRRTEEHARALELIEDIGFLLTVVMWFVFGAVVVFTLWDGVNWRLWLFCAAVLTVVRIAPVMLSLIGYRLTTVETFLIGWLGPRGTTSIVFGLLAFNKLRGENAELALTAMVVTVLGSVLLHGLGSPLTARGYRRRLSARP
ncbi:cation:proton antiporter [Nocardia seriolae]|uniref:cation:proton antiporter n=1 Tax=Nocardia seriolae TaxID=37332 RepID=UPI00051A1994|nr:cation:proton antiporter [Nocardia seriolae]MTJ60359.1 sodium:proton exchanger [Nocardia seriolae]MTJ74485.1 sodium:proton exchanger [Nocardia seriolae]MTJ84803.1 sodium:proton exchanger [Nocardia seriolae]MTK28792.1 sodium:proton exchanger [Nocardia seriolae]MTK38288.1 sodium:proton exchanger [Nocardia seriolae]